MRNILLCILAIFWMPVHKLLLVLLSLILCLSAWSATATPKQAPTPQQHWDIFADLLYWHAGEVGTIPNVTLSTKLDSGLVSKLNVNNMDFGWDFGFRTGGRYHNLGDNQWGISLFYTWFQSEAKKSGAYGGFVGIPPGFPLTGTITDADFLNLIWLFAAQKYHARWTLHFNVIDFQLDHEYAATETITLRPFLGLKSSWIHQDIHIHSIYHDIFANNLPVLAREKLTNHFWGLGPSLGIDTKWCLGQAGNHFFYLFGDLSGAMLWSIWKNTDHLKIGDTIAGTLNTKHRKSGSLVLQNLLGLEWSIKLTQRGTTLALRAGYESQFWFDNLQVFNAFNGRQHNALTLQGGTFDLLFSF